ncbi:hypothetical protein G6F68_009769 [Rhizopus microsporus]|nr:hypothetical protein G6F68_009769 [Rhizopus microsporus]
MNRGIMDSNNLNNNEELNFAGESNERRVHADDDEITSDESTTDEDNPLARDNREHLSSNIRESGSEAVASNRNFSRLQKTSSDSRTSRYVGSDVESLAEELQDLYESENGLFVGSSSSSVVSGHTSIASALKGISINSACPSASASPMPDIHDSIGEGPSLSHVRNLSPIPDGEGVLQQTLNDHITKSRSGIKISSYFKPATSKDTRALKNNNQPRKF